MKSGKIYFKEFIPIQENSFFYVRCLAYFERDEISNYVGIIVGATKCPENTQDQLNLLNELFFTSPSLLSTSKFVPDKNTKSLLAYSSQDRQLAVSFKKTENKYILTLHVPDVSSFVPSYSVLDDYARKIFMTPENQFILPKNFVKDYFTFTNGRKVYCFSFEFLIDHKTLEIIHMNVDKRTIYCIDTLSESIASEYYTVINF